MFDIFDILVPTLACSLRLNVVASTDTPTAADEKRLFIDGRCFARTMRADDAYSNLLSWTGRPGRESWSVLIVDAFANKASADNGAWGTFLKDLEFLLGIHEIWLVTCESDCEATDLEDLTASPSELVQLLDGYRRSKEFMAFRASPRGTAEESDTPKLPMP